MNYLQEWNNSCIDDQLTRLNVIPLTGTCPSNYLFYADTLPRRNDGRVSHRILKRYEHTEQGGWWCSGIDVLTGNDDLWGCFKPSSPRRSTQTGKPIKYEHPPLAPTGVFALRVPLHLWQDIANRYNITLPFDLSGGGFNHVIDNRENLADTSVRAGFGETLSSITPGESLNPPLQTMPSLVAKGEHSVRAGFGETLSSIAQGESLNPPLQTMPSLVAKGEHSVRAGFVQTLPSIAPGESLNPPLQTMPSLVAKGEHSVRAGFGETLSSIAPGESLNPPLQTQNVSGEFWQWLIAHPEIPLCITEGAKKAGALLTACYAAIALPGVFGGYRVPRDEQGNRIGKSRLIPQLLKLATPGRTIYIAFDQDTKPSTIKAVNAAIRQLGYLLTQKGCSVKIISWHPNQGKGVDDLIANHTQTAFDEAYQTAVPLDTWKAQSLTGLTYPPTIQINRRYLGELSIPEDAKLIGIKSPKGTGKTQWLETIVKEAIKRQKWVLVIGHRVRLVEALCQRFGLNYVTQIQDTETGARLGYGLCVDSLHPTSQAGFEAVNWSDGVVIIDEVEQVLWHGLDSETCSSNRVAILKSLKTLMQNVLGDEGQVYVADADLSDVSIDYLISLSGVPQHPYIIHNAWKPSEAESWRVNYYPERKPERLIQDLERHIAAGGKPFVCLSAQKRGSQWGTCTLEAYLRSRFPEAKILRIDSESLTEPTHPAYGSMRDLDGVLSQYDIVLASPVIETGVSIELQGHFTSVWGIAIGVQSENSVRQALGRVRENLPRFLWVASCGFNRVGNGSTSIPALLTSGRRLTQLNIRLLQQSDFDALDDIETGFQAESLLCWARMAVRHNASMFQYRESVLAALRGEGHQVVEASEEEMGGGDSVSSISQTPGKIEPDSLTAAIAAVKDQNYQAECLAIARAKNLSDHQYNTGQKRLVKTLAQRRAIRKYELKQRYRIPVTAQLVAKDDQGWYQKLLLHYFLTLGRDHLAQRDAVMARKLIELGGGSIFLPDFNRSQLGAAVGTMELLGVPVLLSDRGRELRGTDEDLQAMARLALSNRASIKTTLGIGLARNATPIRIVRRLLDKIGYGLQCIGRESKRLNRVRVYQVVHPSDGRFEVFQQWLAHSCEVLEKSHQRLDACSKEAKNKADVDAGVDYVQLCLNLSDC
ncbi:plasmid replication protein, CyRepA1 family [Coleofasciculus sp. D1-CHI-01]|uniref:plasmid replication protein, CyRepA1 family n=1 Tax=Coleofasciculus sp. D1-CHI-01 TaxID=3068482 RepID=UPI0040629502